MDVLKQLVGRLHPLLVHLPIGFILLGLLLQWYDRKRLEFQKVIPLIYLWGGLSATLACITGYLQYLGEGYSFDTVQWHLWSGIATALFSFLMYAKFRTFTVTSFLTKIPLALLSVIFFLLISYTGHQGGNITHGEDFLVEPLPNSIKSALGYEIFEEKEIALNEENWENAQIYEDVIKPILNNKCVSCHNPKKTKGELQMHTQEAMLKGGDNGAILVANNSENSELFLRMNLPMENDKHMPPEGKTQPSKEEIRLVGAWIEAGHPFMGTINEAGLSRELFTSFFPMNDEKDHPDIEIAAAPQDSILAIEKHGVHVDLISKTANFLSVSCINKPSFFDADFERLLPIKNQIAKLDLGGTQVTDAIFEMLAMLPNLTILKLDNTAITGNAIENISSLEHLKSLNLIGSEFETSHMEKLTDFKNLKKVYVYGSRVNHETPLTLKQREIQVDYGNYELPPIASDSIVY